MSSLASLLSSGALSYAQVATHDRIVSPIDITQLSRLPGNLHPLVRPELDLGPASGSMMLERMKLVFQLTAAQERELQDLLQAQQDRKSALYHQWLTPEEYGDRIGLSPNDFKAARVRRFLSIKTFLASPIQITLQPLPAGVFSSPNTGHHF